ncbi:hypothetical protein C922_03430 [Plasmodium inui San Antonio 1]|uniref:Cyanocobalamin reductase (cyanide-eliminating) n=1 Tax=Plasmodium inui San Antonio 1 TaxID=1237626 RepID=W7A3K4_9APIC|nr:hypothetical protein C922_03430 [Plasmodium inui San Antonio 1]EUD66235.1 hypothetical protein C922_03430 [Plasmodium inui San Antonio 1]
MILHRISLPVFYYLFIFAYLHFETAQSKLNIVTNDDNRFVSGFFGSANGPVNDSADGGDDEGPKDKNDEKKPKNVAHDGSEDSKNETTPPNDDNNEGAINSQKVSPVDAASYSPTASNTANYTPSDGIEVRFVPSGSDSLSSESAPIQAAPVAGNESHNSSSGPNDDDDGDDDDDDEDDSDDNDSDEAKKRGATHQSIPTTPPMTINLPILTFMNKHPMQAKMNKNREFGNLYSLHDKTTPQINHVNYFKKELQNEFAFKNGLYFSATSVKEYNQRVDPSKHAYIKLPEDTMVLVITGNKFFFQDLVYSKNKYNAIKKKFSFLMNSMISSLKKKYFFKNYDYQYLYKDDTFAYDQTKRLLDMELLGEISHATQTISVDEEKNKKVTMHKVYGGWFDFLGILVVNGYTMKPEESDNMTQNKAALDVVPKHMLQEFKDLVIKKNDGYDNGYAVGLWRDFPNDKFVPWRYSVELFLWDLLNVLPHELPHPANLIMTYQGDALTKGEEKQVQKEAGKEAEKPDNQLLSGQAELKESQQVDDSANRGEKRSREEILNWHQVIQNKIASYPGFEVKIVAANDYLKAIGYSNEIFARYYNAKNGNAYIFLILINKDFFVDEFVQKGSTHEEYLQAKQNYFSQKMNEILEGLERLLEELREELFPNEERTKPVITFYNYLADEQNYDKLNPHILGEIAGITKHLKCDEMRNNDDDRCTKDISLHHKYGGWFEFAGAINVKNVNFVPTKYENHGEFLKKKYEDAILTQANCNCQDAWLWKDLPEQNMAPYRYPLQVFALENPQFNILNLKEMHPFVVMDILNKGLQALKVQSKKQNIALEEEEREFVTTIHEGSSRSDDSTHCDSGNNSLSASQTKFNYLARECMKKNEVEASQMANTVYNNPEDDDEAGEIDQNEYITENAESDGTSEAEETEYTEDKYIEEEEIDRAEYVEVNEGFSSKPDTQPIPQVEYEYDARTNQEHLSSNDAFSTTGSDGAEGNTHESILFRDITKNFGDNEVLGGSKRDGSDVLKAGDFGISRGLRAVTDLVNKHLASGKGRDGSGNGDDDNDDDDNDDEDNDDYDIYNDISSEGGNDDGDDDDDEDNDKVNLYATNDYLQKHVFGTQAPSSPDFMSKAYIFIIVCLICICIALVVSTAMRLYDTLLKRKVVDMNRTVLSFNTHQDIPVVHGIPAPWMNA